MHVWPSLALPLKLCLLFGCLPAAATVNTSILHSNFEQHNDSDGVRYAWAGSGAHVLLETGGEIRIWLRHSAGVSQPFSLYFPGAARREPQGEPGPSIQAHYYNETNPTGVARALSTRIRYRNLYPGIDLVFHVEGTSLEYDFELAPEANPKRIRIAYRGAGARLGAHGDLEIGGSPVAMTQKSPQVRQMINGSASTIPCRYVSEEGGAFSIALESYDSKKALIIDPVLNFASILGGPGFDAAYAVAVDASGAIYVAGETDSAAFFNAGRRTSRDAFVAKLNPAGTALLYATYFGGSGADAVRGIALDAAGNAYIAGTTNSQDFPATPGSFATTNAGFEDAFAAKLNSAGQIVYATLLGSPGADQGLAIAIDASGNAYVAGQSSGAFPTTFTALQRTYQGATDCFVSKLSPNGASLLYSTLLGGSAFDVCRGIAVDSAGNAYVTGLTYSPDFPGPAKLQSVLKGPADAFVTKINAIGSAILYSTFLGGDGFDEANAIAVDSSGSAYIAGATASLNFPVTYGVAQSSFAGGYDAFIVKMTPAGDALVYSTLVGGSGADTALGIAVDSAGRAMIGGFTNSADFPVRQVIQSSLGGQFDAFAAGLDSGGYTLLFSTYVGGSGDDRAFAMALAAGNRVYLAGVTQSPTLTNTSTGSSSAGNSDAFVVQMTYDNPATSGLNFVPLTPCRIMDTRSSAYGSTFGPPSLKGGSIRVVPVTQSNCRVPALAQAYSVNVTAIPKGPVLQYMTIWPAGQSYPTASTLNSFDGRVVANAAIVPAGLGGSIYIFVTEDTDLIIDINGYFGDPSAGFAFYTLNPCRIADTRGYGSYTPSFSTPFIAGGSFRTFPVSQSPCAPATTPQAYSLNVTALPRTPALQYLIGWPAGFSMPTVSTLNSFKGQVVANAAILGAGVAGGVNILTSEDAEVLLDINGYFGAPGSPGALSFTPVTPCRVADTRRSTPIGTSIAPSRSFDVPGSTCGIPPSARAYSLNITALPAAVLQFLQVWPTGQVRPSVSTLNSFNGAIVANAAIVPAGANGSIDIFASDRADVLIDINGYFAP